MKKLFTTILLIFAVGAVWGQTKIGNLTIDNETAQRYFLDCYNHPDTLTREYVDGCGDAMEREVKQYNEWLLGASINRIIVEIKHPAGMDTCKSILQMSAEMHNCPYGSIKHEKPYFEPPRKPVKGYKGHEKDFIIEPYDAYVEKVEIGFAVPRKPTEIDFIKWIAKNQLTK